VAARLRAATGFCVFQLNCQKGSRQGAEGAR